MVSSVPSKAVVCHKASACKLEVAKGTDGSNLCENYEVETRGFTAFISESLLQPLVAMPGGMDRGMLVQHLNEMLKCIWQHLLRRIDFARRLTDNPIELSAREEHPVKAIGWAARDQSGVLSPFKFSRRATGINDVTFKVLYCGIGHTDLHLIKNDWGMSKYPLVPGHEIVGIVTKVGSKVQKFKVGDKCDGKLVLVGAPGKPLELPVFPLLSGRKIVAGSAIGGIKETQEMIDFAAKHKITADVEVIPIDYVNMAMERLAKADVKYRFVIDIGKTLKDA
ncbi:hypothetical protein RJ639_029183 [Escallonia herrerae]|uniref:Alcohol dehydrogenase-like N-terminal domain-containing protein n=1 Tax=Escallonia herrerae TaxID=1293975 RepID=A0AA88X782_9ASTE|nr:hypothetical protein RJ639_029183 [Escallonia herrerae]